MEKFLALVVLIIVFFVYALAIIFFISCCIFVLTGGWDIMINITDYFNALVWG